MNQRGQALRLRREALGWSLEQVAAETRIPVEHLVALESGRLETLPAGPYAEAWLRTLEAHLGAPEASAAGGSAAGVAPSAVGPVSGGIPLGMVRWVAVGSVALLVGVIAWNATGPVGGDSPGIAVEPDVADQHLVVRARRNAHVRVVADGELVVDKQLVGGQQIEVDARDTIELEVDATDALRIDFNDEHIVPQGRQDEPRRLVFIDDVAGGGR